MHRPLATILLLWGTTGCIRSYALGTVADALSGSGGSYGSDEDPELIKEAVPFGLKTMESVLVEEPEHRGLLTALASGFVQYGFAFVAQEADEVADVDITKALVIRKRTKRLYLRAREYGMRGLEVAHPGFRETFAQDPEAALQMTIKEDVPLLYWTAAASGLAIGSAKDDPEAIADFPNVEKLARRALELDESWNRGALHEFFISFESAAPGGKPERARKHFARAIELSEGTRVGPYVSLAENVSIQVQDSREFHRLLTKALAVDVNAHPNDRLANVIMQRRAARLEATSADLFLDDIRDGATTSTVSMQ